MDPVSECQVLVGRLRLAGISPKYYAANRDAWLIEVAFVDADGIGDLHSMTTAAEVDALIGAYCPACQRIDWRRRRGGPCSACRRG
jgi:hypothetical protein